MTHYALFVFFGPGTPRSFGQTVFHCPARSSSGARISRDSSVCSSPTRSNARILFPWGVTGEMQGERNLTDFPRIRRRNAFSVGVSRVLNRTPFRKVAFISNGLTLRMTQKQVQSVELLRFQILDRSSSFELRRVRLDVSFRSKKSSRTSKQYSRSYNPFSEDQEIPDPN